MSYATRFLHKYYLRLYPDIAAACIEPGQAFEHFRAYGIDESRSPNPFFFPSYYDSIHPDLSGYDGNAKQLLKHWFTHGINEGRRASPFFDPVFYASNYPDVSEIFDAQGYQGVYDHWMKVGVLENRRTVSNISEPIFLGNNNIGMLKPAVRKYVPGISDVANIIIEKEQGVELFFFD